MASKSPHSQVSVPIDYSTSSLVKKLDGYLSMSSNVCIFRVPKILYRHKPEAYKPNAFSIGPFLYGEEHLKPTQKIKLKYLQDLLGRSTQPKEELLRQLTGVVRAMEGEARECYAGLPATISVEDLIEILVLDACFIIELFQKDDEEVKKDPTDPIFSMSCLLEFLKHDLILLENQIPWMVLERLFNMTMVPEGRSLVELTLHFFSNMFSSHEPKIKAEDIAKCEIKHILHLLRLSVVLPLGPLDKGKGWQPFLCAQKIKEYGIKFTSVAPDSILDIKFRHGSLEIPTLLVQETTETIFRNLISFEQCYPNCQPIITSYAKLMDNLIDTPRDVEVLCEKKILDNWLSPEDATQFFNKLYNDAYLKTFYYHDVCGQVYLYRKRWWPRLRRFYTHNFTTPWAIVSQIVGAFVLLLTFAQTYYTMAGYLSDQKGDSQGTQKKFC